MHLSLLFGEMSRVNMFLGWVRSTLRACVVSQGLFCCFIVSVQEENKKQADFVGYAMSMEYIRCGVEVARRDVFRGTNDRWMMMSGRGLRFRVARNVPRVLGGGSIPAGHVASDQVDESGEE